jgi:superfamily II DNA or RNA helicase
MVQTTTAPSSNSPPELGQLAEVRQRRWIVTDVRASTLTPSPLEVPTANGHQHLVSLSSIEDDGLGEELQVIWELEPGACVHERVALPEPTGFDAPHRLDAFLDAVRWGASSTADVRALQAPFRSGIAIEDYQLDPVVRAIQMPRVNLLIADDVGLGKTIEAGLVIQELIVRHRARRVLIVCPASLEIKWQTEMREKFGLDFRIVDADLLKQLRRQRGLHANPWTHFPRLITSLDFVKRERPLRLLREALPAPGQPAYPRRFDFLVVDEAHNVAPSGRGRYATDSLRTHAIRTIAPHAEHKLFVSATPHNGYLESFTALLELLDNQRFARSVKPDRQQLNAVMVRRLKSELPPRWDGAPRFPGRVIEPIEVPYTDAERGLHAALQRYSALRQERARDHAERFASEFVLLLLKKRLFSSPAAFQKTLAQHEQSITAARRHRGAVETPTLGVLRRIVDKVDEDYGDDSAADDAVDEAVDGASRLFSDLSGEERDLLRSMREAVAAAVGRPDSKARELIHWLNATLRPGGTWSHERVIIFTEYRATQSWLHERLAMEGLAGNDRLLTLYGGLDDKTRETVKAAFQADPAASPVRILLATDAASEGIDLQRHCSRLVHYEIPWNPNRMEQRNGRIDRHGQRAERVLVYHFVGKGYRERTESDTLPTGQLEGDLEFLARATIKIDRIRQDLGTVGPVIAQQVEEAMLGRRQRLDTEGAERRAEPVRAMLRFERRLREQIAAHLEQLQETRRELRLSPENIQSVVEIALALAGQPPLREATLPGVWPDPAGQQTRCPVFYLPPLGGTWALCSEGLQHPHTGEIRPITFDHAIAGDRDDVVLAHLNHRLVQMCLRLLRGEVWASHGRKRLHRATARVIPDTALDTPAMIGYARLVIVGGDSQRLHEEVITTGGRLREGRFSRMNVGEVASALSAARDTEPAEPVKQRLLDLWPRHADALVAALEARMRDRTDGLQRTLTDRAEQEVQKISAVLTELRQSILAEIEAPSVEQLELFSSAERDQLDRNLASLRARAERIPAEIAEETEAIRARFARPEPRLFPVAVAFLVPERFARG